RTNADGFAFDALFVEQLEVLLHLLLCVLELLGVRALGDSEDDEECRREHYTTDGRNFFRRKVYERGGEQHHEYGEQADRNFFAKHPDVGRNFPAALAFVLEAQHQHGKAVEGETPDHAERVRLAEDVHVASAEQNRNHLQADDQIDDAVAGSVLALGFAEPVRENSVFGDAVQHAVRSNDRGVDCARENQEANDDDEGAEEQSESEWAVEPHDQLSEEIVFVARYRHMLRNDHHRQQRTHSGKEEAVNRDDNRGALQVLQLRVGDFAVHLRKRLFAAHGQHRMSECHQDADEAEGAGDTSVLQEPERGLIEV